MLYLLYNPLSKNSRTSRDKNKFIKKILNISANEQNEYTLISVLEINDAEGFIGKINQDDKVIIIGGDGTLNHMVNKYNFDNYPYDNIYLFKYGTGNDFRRSFKSDDLLLNITDALRYLPYIDVNGQKVKFLNGAGLGLDGLISKYANERKSKQAYLMATLRAFRDFKPFDLQITCDNKKYVFNNAWMALFMNGPYIGGGMKVAPNIDRFDQNLDLVIISNISKFSILFLFPSIYKGKHIKYKKYVTVIRGKKFQLHSTTCPYLQTDGEVLTNYNGFTVNTVTRDLTNN